MDHAAWHAFVAQCPALSAAERDEEHGLAEISAFRIPLSALQSLGLRAQALAWAEDGAAGGLTAYQLIREGWLERGEALVNGIIDCAGVAWGSDPAWIEAGTIERVLELEQSDEA